MHNDIDHVLLDEATILQRLDAMARDITRDYEGRMPTVVCILHGGIILMADLSFSLAACYQNVVRPPDVSKVDAVVKLHSSLAMKQAIAADSATSPSRPIGIFERM